jgi:hypothetical protein
MTTKEDTGTTTYTDKLITCIDCGDLFVFEAGEAYFFAMKKFPEPRRCPACRERRRLALNGGNQAVPQW